MNCDYCTEDVNEDDYLEHLQTEHTRDEVSSIDERKVESEFGGFKNEQSLPTNAILLGGGIVFLILALAAIFFVPNTTGSDTSKFEWVETEPSGSGHYHGELYVTIDGQELDFSQQKYQLQDDAFHFESGQGVKWHGHAQSITLQYALATLDIKATDDELTFEGTTYTTDNYEISYTVNGQSVSVDYVLQPEDEIRVTVTER